MSRDYPGAAVRIIEPFGPGGGVDVLASAVADELARLWGPDVTVENCPGAGSIAAPKLVATSPPDGYTLLINTSAHAYSAAVVSDLPYNPLTDFVAVAPLTSQAYVLVAAVIDTLDELIERAKARPDELTHASAGTGTGTHLACESLNLLAGITTTHIPADPGDDIAATIAKAAQGTTDFAMSPIPIAAPHIRNGALAALGVSASLRSPLLPDVPTIAEAGVAGYDFPIWYGLWAPAGTPTAIADKLARDVATVLAEPDLREWFADHGATPFSMSRNEFAAFVVAESERAARIFTDS